MSESPDPFADLADIGIESDIESDHDIGRREYLDIAMAHKELFSPFEREFISSTAMNTSFSSKQREIINRMGLKHPEIY